MEKKDALEFISFVTKRKNLFDISSFSYWMEFKTKFKK